MPPEPKPTVRVVRPSQPARPAIAAPVVNKGGRPKGAMTEDSLTDRLLNTQVGGCQAIAKSIPVLSSTQSQINDIKASLRTTLRRAWTRAAEKAPHMHWIASTTDYRDQCDNLVIVATMTRVT